jgi:hypothetical protein
MEQKLNTDNSFELDASGGLDPKTLLSTIKAKGETRPLDTTEEEAPKSKVEKLVLSKLQLAEIIQAQIENIFDSFRALYNTDSRNIRFLINMIEKQTESSATRILEITMVKNGQGIIIYRKAYGFTHPKQVENKGEWMLTLWKDALATLISGGILYSMILDEQRKLH